MRSALRNPYVVQEALEPVVDVFPVLQYGHLEMQKMRSRRASAFLSGQGAGLFQLADRGGAVGFLHVVGSRADVHFGTEVIDLHLGSQIRYARRVARVRHAQKLLHRPPNRAPCRRHRATRP